jgi:hypothetical protein
MLSINETATQKVFSGLKCAYTGRPVTVRVVACGASRPMFFCPDAFDPSIPVPDLADLLRKASARNGVEGSVSGDNVLVCPYTGDRMSVSKDASGFFLTGGFRPSCPHPDPAEFAALMRMRMRGGIGSRPTTAKLSVSFPEADRKVGSVSDKPKDFSLEYAQSALKPFRPAKVSVTVPETAARRRRKG